MNTSIGLSKFSLISEGVYQLSVEVVVHSDDLEKEEQRIEFVMNVEAASEDDVNVAAYERLSKIFGAVTEAATRIGAAISKSQADVAE